MHIDSRHVRVEITALESFESVQMVYQEECDVDIFTLVISVETSEHSVIASQALNLDPTLFLFWELIIAALDKEPHFQNIENLGKNLTVVNVGGEKTWELPLNRPVMPAIYCFRDEFCVGLTILVMRVYEIPKHHQNQLLAVADPHLAETRRRQSKTDKAAHRFCPGWKVILITAPCIHLLQRFSIHSHFKSFR